MTFRRMLLGLLALAGTLGAADGPATLGSIDFFGHKGIDVRRVLAQLPVRTGDPFSLEDEDQVGALRERMESSGFDATGQRPTDVAFVCCDAQQRWMIFIGLAGQSSTPLPLRARPSGKRRLAKEIEQAHARMMEALVGAVQQGGEEDRTEGYALSREPILRAAQQRFGTLRENNRISCTACFRPPRMTNSARSPPTRSWRWPTGKIPDTQPPARACSPVWPDKAKDREAPMNWGL